MLSTYLLMGAVSFGVVMQLRGQPAGIADCLQEGFKAAFRVVGTGLICIARILIGTLLFIIPGIIEFTRLFVAVPIAVIEGHSGNTAARRSVQLTDGSRWQIFGAYLVTVLIGTLVVVASLGFMTGALAGAIDADRPWLEIGVGIPMQTFAAVMVGVAYFQLRKGKENVDAEDVARVFD